MDKQAAAERDRREQVLRAEGAKRRAELESEGVRISLQNESEVSTLQCFCIMTHTHKLAQLHYSLTYSLLALPNFVVNNN